MTSVEHKEDRDVLCKCPTKSVERLLVRTPYILLMTNKGKDEKLKPAVSKLAKRRRILPLRCWIWLRAEFGSVSDATDTPAKQLVLRRFRSTAHRCAYVAQLDSDYRLSRSTFRAKGHGRGGT